MSLSRPADRPRLASRLSTAGMALLWVPILMAAAQATSSDAGDIIAYSIFPEGVAAGILAKIHDVVFALPEAVKTFGTLNDWLWTLGLSLAGIMVGTLGRWLVSRLLSARNGTSKKGKLALWIGRELFYFACVMTFFAFIPPWPHIHGMAVTLAVSWGMIELMRSLTLVILKVGHSPDLRIVRDVGYATAIIAAGFVVLGLLRLSGTDQTTRTIIGLFFWLAFLWLCGQMIIRFRAVTSEWRITEVVADPISTLLLGQRSLFFGGMLLTIGIATIVSAFVTGPRSYLDGVFSIALLALLPTAVAMTPALIGNLTRNFGPWQQALVRSARLLTFVLFWVVLAKVWDINPFDTASNRLGQAMGRITIDICIAIALAYLLWELMRTGLDILSAPQRSAIPSDDTDHIRTATRVQTFIPLLRTLLLGFIFAATGMIALAALGVNIGPLLAGAGIIGVAIGFGSQSLVKDVISGIFFLADDAFRIGEYLEVGSAKGTVEAISIRSLKLRHPRGALYTVPFGSISMVNNQSRDYVIVKLEFMVAFDSDLIKAKKLIKEINVELMNDPELGAPLLQPIKFQGVRRMEQYGIVVGVKFTARPGEQWVLRREVFQRVRDAFHKAGIAFARPQVIVQVPGSEHVSDAALEAAAGIIATNTKPEPENEDRKS